MYECIFKIDKCTQTHTHMYIHKEREGGRERERYNEGGRGKEGEGRKVRETTFKGRLLLCAGCGVRWEKLQYGKKERVGR